MSQVIIIRPCVKRSVRVDEGETVSSVFGMSGYSFGSFQLPAGVTGADVKLQVTNTELKDEDGRDDGVADPATFIDCPDYDANATGGAHGSMAIGADGGGYLWAEGSAWAFGRLVFGSAQAEALEIPIRLV